MVSFFNLISMMLVGAAILAFIAVSSLFLIWWERKVSAHIQTRLGPMRVGWHGLLQTIADATKLLLKEDIVPQGVDKPVWWLAPFFVVVPSVMAFVSLPFGKNLIVKDLNVGILYIVAITSVGILGIFM